jgi:hypothetical protein
MLKTLFLVLALCQCYFLVVVEAEHDVVKAIEILKKIDTNSDGGLSREEMMEWLANEKKENMDLIKSKLNDVLTVAFHVRFQFADRAAF